MPFPEELLPFPEANVDLGYDLSTPFSSMTLLPYSSAAILVTPPGDVSSIIEPSVLLLPQYPSEAESALPSSVEATIKPPTSDSSAPTPPTEPD